MCRPHSSYSRSTCRQSQRVDVVELSTSQRVTMHVCRPPQGRHPDELVPLPAAVHSQRVRHGVQQNELRNGRSGFAAPGHVGHLVHARHRPELPPQLQGPSASPLHVRPQVAVKRNGKISFTSFASKPEMSIYGINLSFWGLCGHKHLKSDATSNRM